MNVARWIANRLALEGIDLAFLVQGAANNDIIYAIADARGIDYVCPMHEQAAGFMAEGWSKVSGKPGLVIATSGPGGQNLVTPLGNFFYDSVPGIFITGQVNSKFMRPSPDIRQLGFQEWPIAEVVRPIVKRATLCLTPTQVVEELELALILSVSGRPGPVLLDIPIDVQRMEAPEFVPNSMTRVTSTVIQDDGFREKDRKIDDLVDHLRRAERPVMIIGGGCSNERTRQDLGELVSIMPIPLVPTWNALDVVSPDWPDFGGLVGTYGGAGRNFAAQNADLLVTVGSRVSGRITGGVPETFARRARKYFVDVDPALLRPELQPVRADVNLLCYADEFLSILERKWRSLRSDGEELPRWEPWRERIADWLLRYDPVSPAHFATEAPHPYAFARLLSDALPENAVISVDCGGNVVAMNHAFRQKAGQRYFTNNGNSPMGFSFAAAIGAALADPTRPVVCVIGDGGFNMNIQELQTAKNLGAKVKTFILDNRVYGITRSFQENHYPGRYEASGPPHYVPPDFLAVARAYGVEACSIDRSGQISSVIDFVMRFDGPVVCAVNSPNFHAYVPKIDGWATPIEDMTPRLPREEFRSNMIIDPLPGWETGNYGGGK